MKNCVHCGQYLPDEAFNWRYKALGVRHKICRECEKGFRKDWYESHKEEHLGNVYARKERVRQEAREYIWNYLSNHHCSSCGESDPVVLEFHHRHGKEKEISRMIADGLSLATIQREIEKCDVLCANCHRRVTSSNQGWFRGNK